MKSSSMPDKGVLSRVCAAIIEEEQRDYDSLDVEEGNLDLRR